MTGDRAVPIRTKSGVVELVYAYRPGSDLLPGTVGRKALDEVTDRMNEREFFYFVEDDLVQIWKFSGLKQDAIAATWKTKPLRKQLRHAIDELSRRFCPYGRMALAALVPLSAVGAIVAAFRMNTLFEVIGLMGVIWAGMILWTTSCPPQDHPGHEWHQFEDGVRD